jgi:hypothetical protein
LRCKRLSAGHRAVQKMTLLSPRLPVVALFVFLIFSSGMLMSSTSAQPNSNPALSPSSSRTLDGYLGIVYGDSVDGHYAPIRYYLSLSNGTKIRLSPSTPPPFGWFDKHVVVSGTLSSDYSPPGGAERTMSTNSIVLYQGQNSAQSNPNAVLASQIGTKKLAIILLKFSDLSAEPHPPSFFTGIVNPSTGNTVNVFYQADSYGKLSMQADVFGWYTLPKTKSQYAPCGFDSSCADTDSLFNDGTSLAISKGVNFANYDFVSLVFNNDLDCCAYGGGQPATLSGVSKIWPTTWLPIWSAEVGTYSHELGHALGLPHSGWVYYAYDSPWDVMSGGNRNNGTPCGSYNSANESGLNDTITCYTPVDTIAPYKDVLGWIDSAHLITVPAGGTTTVTLDSLAETSFGANPVMVKVCVAGRSCTSPTETTIGTTTSLYFTVEARTHTGAFDQYLPGEGIIIHAYDGGRPPQGIGNPCFFNDQSGPAYPIDSTPGDGPIPSACPNLDFGGRNYPNYALYNAQWSPGQTYTDSTYNFAIKVVSRAGNSFAVTIAVPAQAYVSGTFLALLPVTGGTSSGPHGDQSGSSTGFAPSLESLSITGTGAQQYLLLATSQLWDSSPSIGASIAVCRDGSRVSGDMFSVGAVPTHRHLATAIALDTPSVGSHTYTLCYKTDPGGTAFVSGTVLVAVPVSGAVSSGPGNDQSTASTNFVASTQTLTPSTSGSQQYLLVATSQLWDSLQSIGASMAICKDGARISGDMYSAGATSGHRHLATAVALDNPSAGSHTYSLCYKTDPGGTGFMSATYLVLVPVSGAVSSGPGNDQSTFSQTFTPSTQSVSVSASGSLQYLAIATSQLWDSYASSGASMAVCMNGSTVSGDMYSAGAIATHRHLATAISLNTPPAGSRTYSLCYKTDPGIGP